MSITQNMAQLTYNSEDQSLDPENPLKCGIGWHTTSTPTMGVVKTESIQPGPARDLKLPSPISKWETLSSDLQWKVLLLIFDIYMYIHISEYSSLGVSTHVKIHITHVDTPHTQVKYQSIKETPYLFLLNSVLICLIICHLNLLHHNICAMSRICPHFHTSQGNNWEGRVWGK